MATKRQVSTSSVVELFQRVLKFKRNAFVNPSQRVYTPGAHQLGVPADLLRHPYVVIDGESQPSPDEIDMLYQQYPIHHVLVTDEKQTAVYHGGVGRVYTPRQLRQAFGYREVDDSTRGDLLESWMRRPLALCSDHDYMLLTLHSVYALLVEFGFTRSQALRCVGRILLGFAVGTPLTAELWLQPELLGRTLSARAASILQDTCAVALDASTWLRLIYLMAPVDWSQMRWDLLGPLYTQTLSRADRRSAGIFYTPPELVDQVLDTAGVVERLPVTGRILEPCAGSGAFVVRLLARVRSAAGEPHAKQQVKQLLQLLTAIEPDAAAAELLRYNVAIQWASACGRQVEALPHWDLRCCDALLCYSPFESTPLPGTERTQCKVADTNVFRYDIGTDFAFVLGNPPYVGESGNKALFAQYRNHPFWQQYSESKMDFLQYFFVLALTKIQTHPCGRICFLTSAYWLTADGARRLRELILGQAIIKRALYIQTEQSLFKDAPGHHSVITLLERCADSQVRDAHQVKVQELAPYAPAEGDLTLNEAVKPLQEVAGHVFGKPQGSLRGEPWFLQVRERYWDLLRELERGPALNQYFAAKQGVAPGTQRIGQAELRLLGPAWVAEKGIEDGTGVFVLTSAEVAALNLPAAETRFIRPFVKSSFIQPFAIVADTPLWLIYLRHDAVRAHECPVLLEHLARFRPLLERKREYHLGKRDWFHIHWPRDEQIFAGEKIMTAQRGSRPAFAWTEKELFAATDVYFIVVQETTPDRWSLPALTGILNSSLGWFWFAHRTKAKGEQREFFSRALEQFPLPAEHAARAAERNRMLTRLDQLVRQLHAVDVAPELEAAWLSEVDALVFRLYDLNAGAINQIRTWAK
ncbi:MAG TPA: N-6 DNA methylase [Firmicutes bacterium]|nr:N-6 DNA methylase [Bacillota bacterium]